MRITPRLIFSVALAALISPAVPSLAEPDAAASSAAATATPARSQAAVRALQGVAGRVLGQDAPLSSARVYAFQLADASLHRSVTDAKGGFHFDTLPVGLYKVIAHKAGFVPAVVMLTRAADDAYQFVEVRLAAERAGQMGEAEDFWSVRARIPPDVLREIAVAEFEADVREGKVVLPEGVSLQAEMRAMTGRDQITALGDGQVTSGGVGVAGRFGNVEIDVDGDFRQLDGESRGMSSFALNGEENRFSVRVASGDDTLVNVTSLSNSLQPLDRPLSPDPTPVSIGDVDFEHYRVSVSQALGARAHSEFAAQYTSENNFHRHGWIDPLGIPEASESWHIEGSYSSLLTGRTQLETGFRYNELQFTGDPAGVLLNPPAHERMDFFGRAGTQLLPRVFVEYGLYTTLRDGSLSLAPRGGVVIDLGSDWKAAATVSQTVHDEAPDGLRTFAPMLYGDAGDGCDAREESCYRLVLSRTYGEGEDRGQVEFSAIHRELADTLRLYFSRNFFDRLESLYMVPGDELPEVGFAFSRRLAPNVLARFESNVASGGGGIFYATDRQAYENAVRYLVTSMDTRFQSTDTGLFVAFHHLQQELSSIHDAGPTPTPLELERLQVMLTQDLGILAEMASDLAIHLNMEVSRGSDPFSATPDDELRKRILGGLAFKF